MVYKVMHDVVTLLLTGNVSDKGNRNTCYTLSVCVCAIQEPAMHIQVHKLWYHTSHIYCHYFPIICILCNNNTSKNNF